MIIDEEATNSHIVKEKEDCEAASYIGNELMNIRILLNMSQKDFAEAILVNRATVNKIERGNPISSDIAFRLYYAMQKIQNNIYMDDDIKEQCHNLQKYIELNCILGKCRISHIAYSPKDIIGH